MASEFEVIRRFFSRPIRHTQLGVGDDAALISVAPGMELAVSTDMLVSGTHFFGDADPCKLGWKSLAVNLSDMAAMGANPKWATLAIALSDTNEEWLAQFASGFFNCAEKFCIDLIGGDTTRGPLTISIQIMGEVPAGKALKRSGAKVGDEIWVSGTLGTAALALKVIEGAYPLAPDELDACLPALNTPEPRVGLGLALQTIATSAIDISDGLLADLGHILECSKVGAEISLKALPSAKIVSNHLHDKAVQKMMLSGGDDYELCFTASKNAHNKLLDLSNKLALQLTPVGLITSHPGLIVHGLNNEKISLKETGFDHFAN